MDYNFDQQMMLEAIEEAKKCVSVTGAFNVGAILTKNNVILTRGYSRELPGNTHAEECCLLKLSNLETARGCVIYSTMEPCGERLSKSTCCAELILHAGIIRVVQGVKEPNTFIRNSVGTQLMIDGGIKVEYLPGFEDECLKVNQHLHL
ncbi:cytidine deaminase-like protein [Globomyces pollinis-pini]|nr:cytidine deaminase-like protein [Globomyces pollinis-pini]